MDLGCSCIYDDDVESCDVFDYKTVKARKKHVCCECGDDIKKGEYYEYSKWLYDGTWDDARTCLVCVNIRKSIFCGSYVVGELKAIILEEFGIDYTKHVE